MLKIRSSRIGALLIFALSLVLFITSTSAQVGTAPPIVQAPGPVRGSDSGMSESEMEQLIKQIRKASPTQAVAILKNFASSYKIDLNDIPSLRGLWDPTIELPRTVISPPKGTEPSLDFMIKVLLNEIPQAQQPPGLREELLARFPKGQIPIIAQFNRRLSLGEIIQLYELGVKDLVEPLNDLTYIVYVPYTKFRDLEKFPERRWLGEFKPEYKLALEYQGVNYAFIEPIDIGRDEYEADLKNLGVRVVRYDQILDKYYVQMGPLDAEKVVNLWWVKFIAFLQPEESLQKHHQKPLAIDTIQSLK